MYEYAKFAYQHRHTALPTLNALPIRMVRAYRADYSESISAFGAEKKMNKICKQKSRQPCSLCVILYRFAK